jgi:hypothetical protein
MRIRTGLALAIIMLPGLTANLAATPFPATDLQVRSISRGNFTEQVAHRRTHPRAAVQSGAANAASTEDVFNDDTVFGSGGRINADDDFAFGGYDPDVVVDYRNGWNTLGPYNDGFGYGAGYGMGMWGW